MAIATTLEIPGAAALVAAIAPETLSIVRHTPIVGPTSFVWAMDEDDRRALEVLRDKAVAAAVGYAFAEACNDAERRQFAAVANSFTSIDDLLNARFGDPEALAAAWGIRDWHRLNTIWQAECARAAAVGKAA
ncbi:MULTISPECIES: hypothetical protein [unclassified Novosphingobium]|uniref:hypothetical protein n=1 Tax=unclassified Novosphingobium TaxID=2644732 RepID=UPI000D318360|nr:MULTISPECIES: hypothetical protein [unclassified Novosphingobium]PTR05124.1 hypothetical protein C8K11_1444 [Novosphingobium sp. GV055]PUA93740.1 hypothetical protein C8K12_1444 [Novosphingobium sp. GV061]PUB10280.1 hypothetical protein C8K14_1464 [Novosphingobium sp. GV079]PUB36443.1 hypothetical protein C8K10_1434 [Novosphingobium sp. GV027]